MRLVGSMFVLSVRGLSAICVAHANPAEIMTEKRLNYLYVGYASEVLIASDEG